MIYEQNKYYKEQIQDLSKGILESVNRIDNVICELENSKKTIPDMVKAIEKLTKEATWLEAIKIDITIIQEIVEREL